MSEPLLQVRDLATHFATRAGTARAVDGVTFEVQAGARPGEYTVALQCQAQVPFAKDLKGAKPNTLVALPSRPIAIAVKASVKK